MVVVLYQWYLESLHCLVFWCSLAPRIWWIWLSLRHHQAIVSQRWLSFLSPLIYWVTAWCKQPLRSVWTLVGRVFNIWWKWVTGRLWIITDHCFGFFNSLSHILGASSCSDRCGCECGPLATESCRWCRRPAGQVASPELPGASYGYTIWCTSWLVIVIVAPFWYNYATFGTLVAAVWC